MEEKPIFTQEMRQVTKNIHNVSDAMVNAKLGISMSDDSVWAEGEIVYVFKYPPSVSLSILRVGATCQNYVPIFLGLLVFYEVFKFLEESTVKYRDSLMGELLIPGMLRREAFEADLSHFLGKDWRDSYVIRPQVETYLDHLKVERLME